MEQQQQQQQQQHASYQCPSDSLWTSTNYVTFRTSTTVLVWQQTVYCRSQHSFGTAPATKSHRKAPLQSGLFSFSARRS